MGLTRAIPVLQSRPQKPQADLIYIQFNIENVYEKVPEKSQD